MSQNGEKRREAMKAVRVHKAGGPEGMVYEDVPDPQAGEGQAMVKLEAIGLNFAEVNRRRHASSASLPMPLGGEAAGTVIALGKGVSEVEVGDRVAFTGVPGAYAEMVSAPVARLVRLPHNVSTKQAAAALLQGMTAHYLACSTYPLGDHDTCLVHAAAGGVGLLLCQIAKQRGARVIGTVSTEQKAKAAREAGADDVILYTQVDFAQEVKRLTHDRGVDVVYDSVGRTTFAKSLDCLRARGVMVVYGQASGPIDPIDTSLLSDKGCLYLTRVNLGTYTATRQELEERAGDIFRWVGSGQLKVHVFSEYPLSEAAKAQAALEHRETIGKVLLIP
jgi:NADPH2:quinone reductase